MRFEQEEVACKTDLRKKSSFFASLKLSNVDILSLMNLYVWKIITLGELTLDNELIIN